MGSNERKRRVRRSAVVTRRGFAKLAVAAGASLAAPALAQARARVVVVGGGAGGATVARYIGKDSERIDVTLVNDGRLYTTCFFSNLYLAGLRSLSSLTHDLGGLADRYGVNLALGRASGVDRQRRLVLMDDGAALPYDRLVLSPGISFRFEETEGLSAEARRIMPHAYTGGRQTFELRRRIDAMRRGGVFVISVPPNPYRCPPGPYERVSMVANLLRRINPRAKIIVLDAKDKFAKQELFLSGWKASYGDMIEWVSAEKSGGGLARVDAQGMTLHTRGGDVFRADAACVIPPQQAAEIVRNAGLTVADSWAPIDGSSMRSLIDPNVFVLGDSSNASPMPKSGFSANSQAHVAANAVRADLGDGFHFPAKYRNTCWSFVDHQNVIKIGASYEAKDAKIETVAGFVSAPDDDAETRVGNTFEANSWYSAMTADMYS